ncbi:RING finger protein unkempt isoform X2 [Cylas formicarius]|uniref:RING finger protein unkempt isoform X2 n=2 Tax=Cylas formicarius TaxID=197179 RepID=UPI002958ADC3|nr:RING finger protein unkempt isoform X2 [Cylas formicarius]
MPSESKPLLTAQTEKPNHYSYLKEFRVEQCPLFLQHKCTQHRPFTCFHWHFMNQRRRRPVRRRDGTFNYSADNYCTKYDETTGICPDGDDCPYLHRTAGDTERRYHLRYYKTCMCVHDTDSRGYCVKNGLHCAFAHGSHDHRPPVYDIKEIQALEAAEIDGCCSTNGPNALDKERNLMNEDPKWQDTNFVLSNYKTEPCKRPPRLCRQGYACPQYHNSKDKRRSPRKFKYRSTPCPNVKHGEEWGEPGNCDAGDLCSYCHTRTEQQFHPEIYKSTKCNDVQQSGYCPRGVFCAFAHVEQELGVSRDTGDVSGTNLAEILSNALPPSCSDLKIKEKSSESSNGSSEVSESASSTSSIGSNSCSSNKAPGAQLAHKSVPFQRHPSLGLELTNKLLATEKDSTLDPLEREQRKQALCFTYSTLGGSFFSTGNDTVESVVGNALDELNLEDLNISGALERELESESPTVSNSISVGLASSAGLLGSSAPVNIPSSARSGLSGFSPTNNSPLQPFLSATRFSQSDAIDFLNHGQMQLSSSTSKLSGYASFFDFPQSISPNSRNHHNSFSMSPSVNNNLEMVRLREELSQARLQLTNWEERLQQARTACEAWQRETEEANRKTKQVENKLQDTVNQYNTLKQEFENLQGGPHIRSITKVSELTKLPLGMLKNLHAQLRQDLEEIEKVLYRETASKCMVCEERNRTVTLNCNHFVLCDTCASTQSECPYCQTPNNLVNNI